MAAVLILDFKNFKILLADGLQRFEMHQHFAEIGQSVAEQVITQTPQDWGGNSRH